MSDYRTRGAPRRTIQAGDSASIDAFARLRVSNPETLFDSKQIHDSQPLFWDDQQVSGGGTTSTHNANQASTTIAVGATTAGKRVRQTKQRMNYQPGKSALIFLTGVIGAGASGITAQIGYFDDNNGLIFQNKDGVMQVVVRTKTSGSVVNNTVNQASWNLDTMNGTGPSGITLDFTKTQIFLIDFEWLGVGRVRFGFVVDGIPIYCHEVLNANALTVVYMSTPNLPVRYAIENDGTAGAASLTHICTTVISEGGTDFTGILRYGSVGATHVTASLAGTVYAVYGIRLKSTHLDAVVKEVSMSMIAETNDDFEWTLRLNPTVAGTFTFADQTNSCVQTATGATANTVTGGTILNGGFAQANTAVDRLLPSTYWMGSLIDGTADRMVLCVMPLSPNADIHGSLTWREL